MVLSQRGREALSPLTDTLDLFELDELATTIALDLVAFAPIEDAKLSQRVTRVVQELALPSRERAASAISAAQDAFEFHFDELRAVNNLRWLDNETRVHSVDDVQEVGTFPAAFHIPVRWSSGDKESVEPDFSELSDKGRARSRNPLISAFSTRIKSFAAPRDHQAAYDLVAELDDNLLRRDGLRGSLQQADWAALSETKEGREFRSVGAPGLRLVGSTATPALRSALLDWTQSISGSPSATKTPVFWLPPRMTTWGRTIPFLNFASSLSTAHAQDDGTVLLARCEQKSDEYKLWKRLYGRTRDLQPVFDRCLAVPATNLPNSLELVIKPGAWVLILIHAPDPSAGYPFPFGYITAARAPVDRFAHRIAELAAGADGTKAVLWHRENEDEHLALAMIDEALGIEVG